MTVSSPPPAPTPSSSTAWRPPVDVGAQFGIKNIQFPEVFAGDDNRAAFAFLGTTTAGDDQAPDFTGVWHLYVAYTYDGGQTWTTQLAFDGGFGHDASALFADLALDNAGNPYIAFGQNLADEWDMFVEASFDGGKTWNGHTDGTGQPYNYQYDGAPTVNEQFLMARRLVEAGARCVTLSYGRGDSHGKNFDLVRDHGTKLG